MRYDKRFFLINGNFLLIISGYKTIKEFQIKKHNFIQRKRLRYDKRFFVINGNFLLIIGGYKTRKGFQTKN